MFQFTAFAYRPYFTWSGIIGSYSYRVSSFRHLRINARLAAPRNLSWPSPSFIASMSQGIRLVPWVAYHINSLISVRRLLSSAVLLLRLFADLWSCQLKNSCELDWHIKVSIYLCLTFSRKSLRLTTLVPLGSRPTTPSHVSRLHLTAPSVTLKTCHRFLIGVSFLKHTCHFIHLWLLLLKQFIFFFVIT